MIAAVARSAVVAASLVDALALVADDVLESVDASFDPLESLPVLASALDVADDVVEAAVVSGVPDVAADAAESALCSTDDGVDAPIRGVEVPV